jgi:hypothetical protein
MFHIQFGVEVTWNGEGEAWYLEVVWPLPVQPGMGLIGLGYTWEDMVVETVEYDVKTGKQYACLKAVEIEPDCDTHPQNNGWAMEGLD